MVNKFLDKAQRLLKVDIRYVIRGNLWLNLNRAVSIINGLILSVAFANLITKETYGTYTFALAALGLFSMPQTTGLASAISKSVSRGNDGVLFEAFRKILPWSIGGALLLALLSLYYFVMGNITLFVIFIVGAITLPLSVITGVSKSFFSFKGDFSTPAKFNIWRTPLMTGTLVLTGWLTQSALWIVVINTLGNLLLSSFLYLKMRKKYPIQPVTSTGNLFAGKFAFHMGTLSIFSYLSEQLDDILLWKFVGAAPVATYAYATAPVREIKALIENQSALAMPKFAKKEFSEVTSNLKFRVRQLYFIAVPLIVLYVLAAPFIFQIFFPQYIEAVNLSRLASLSLLSAPRRLMSVAISAHQRIKESYIMIVLPNIIRIVLAIALIPSFGITGAIVALLISEVIDYIILGILIRRPFKSEQLNQE
jgi:O-antigen/teichoic acid export membrane protein